jgi:hypothetical protein
MSSAPRGHDDKDGRQREVPPLGQRSWLVTVSRSTDAVRRITCHHGVLAGAILLIRTFAVGVQPFSSQRSTDYEKAFGRVPAHLLNSFGSEDVCGGV